MTTQLTTIPTEVKDPALLAALATVEESRSIVIKTPEDRARAEAVAIRINGAIKDCLRRAAKEVVAVAVRRRCSELVYRDLLPAGDRAGRRAPWLDDAWCPGLAWHALRDRIKTLCHEQGVQYTYDSDGAAVPARWSVQDDIAEHLGEGDGGV